MARLFDLLIGHHQPKERLLSALTEKRLSPNLLLVGPGGIGKSRFARALAQEIVCPQKTPFACGICPACRRIERGESESLLHILPDGLQIKIDQAQKILDFLSLRAWGSSRVVILEEAHRLNIQAANSLLKSLEEPPDGTYFILTAMSAYSLLSTIRSRSQLVRLAPLSRSELRQYASAHSGTNLESWMIESSMGSLDIFNQLCDPDAKKQRQQTLHLWSQLGERSPSDMSRDVFALADGAEESLKMSRWARQLLRDALFHQQGLVPYIHSDFLIAIEQLSQFDERVLLWLHDELLQIEEGIRKNWDRQLTWEAFFIRAQEAIRLSQER